MPLRGRSEAADACAPFKSAYWPRTALEGRGRRRTGIESRSPASSERSSEARLVEQLEAWLRPRAATTPGNFAPTGAEVRFGPRRSFAVEDPELSADEPLVCLTTDGSVTLAGRIDLVAVGEAGSLLRVTDFKVPRHLTTPKRIQKAVQDKNKKQFVFAGELSQLPAYEPLFAAETLSGSRGFPDRIRAEYAHSRTSACRGSPDRGAPGRLRGRGAAAGCSRASTRS